MDYMYTPEDIKKVVTMGRRVGGKKPIVYLTISARHRDDGELVSGLVNNLSACGLNCIVKFDEQFSPATVILSLREYK
jgi:hypothetical protein